MSANPREIVVVLGMHRSGTSAIAGLLEQLGASLGNCLIPAAEDNALGFFEDADCVALNEDILNELGLGWQSCSAIVWDEATLQLLQARFAGRAIGIVRRLIHNDAPVTAVKDPRMSRLLPFWQQVFINANVAVRYLWVTRSPNAVSQSLHARNSYSEEVSLALWARYNLDIARDTKGTECERINFDQALTSEETLATRLASIYGLAKPEQGLNAFFSPSLEHSQKHNADDATTHSEQSLYNLCNALYDHIIAGRGAPASTELESVLTGCAPLLNQITALVDGAKLQKDAHDNDQNLLQEKLNTTRRSADLREEALQTEIRRVATDNEQLNVEREELHAELHRLNAQVEDILSSRSWKLTSVFRFIGRKLRGALSPRIYTKVYVQFIFSKLSHRIASFATSSRSNQAATRELARGRGRALAGALERFDQNPQELPDIDITVVTHNSSQWIEGFLNSLAEQSYPLSNIGLFVTDNHSTDGSFEKMRSLTEPYADRLREISIETGPNNGFGHGQDAAIARGDSRFILITNIDVEFTPQSILDVVSHALRDPKDIASWELRQQPFEHPKYYDPVTLHTSWSSHACILMLRDAYDSVGGYEKRIFMYGEDVELSYRLRRSGYHLKYVPSARINHYTYEDEDSFKPLQFYGSTLANAYIRLRYGNFRDVLGIAKLHTLLLADGGPQEVSRYQILKNIARILVNTPYFLLSRKKPLGGANFPFRKWDYEMVREGSFYTLPERDRIKPTVSIITRTYSGRERWLYESITSVINQTYDHIELIIVEDGGETQKDLVERCKSLFAGDRVIRYSAQPKRGRSFNGNAGLKIATGDHIMFLDDDDLLFPDHVEILAGELMAEEEISAAYALSWEVATTYYPDEQTLYSEHMHTTPDLLRQEFDREILQRHNYLPIQSVLFRRGLFEHYGGFDVEMFQLEDWDLWFRYSSESNFKYIAKVTSLYRTPYNTSERASRHQLLHENYAFAKGKQVHFLRSLPIMESSTDDVTS